MTPSRTAVRPRRDASAQLRGRAGHQWLRQLGRTAAVTVLLAMIGGTAWLVGWSDVTALERVRVRGAGDALADQVLAAVDAPLGVPLIRVNTGRLEQRARALPELAEVSVHRSWPRSIIVEVTPRMPRAAVQADGVWWLVDAGGVLFGRAADRAAGLPVLEAPSGEDAAATRAAGVAVLTSLPADLGSRVERVSARSAADVRLNLDTGALVLWGSPADADRKAQVLRALLAEDAKRYDVSAPDRPALTP
ncbi:MAG: FtsQ-type POTRA domain-containing protein [Jiangellaceae bacterium]|nr:FtsQ-type POTRA domain-containing protein [Jiangellaceae bacterium]